MQCMASFELRRCSSWRLYGLDFRPSFSFGALVSEGHCKQQAFWIARVMSDGVSGSWEVVCVVGRLWEGTLKEWLVCMCTPCVPLLVRETPADSHLNLMQRWNPSAAD